MTSQPPQDPPVYRDPLDNPNYDGQGKTFQEEADATTRMLGFVLILLVAALAGLMIGVIIRVAG